MNGEPEPGEGHRWSRQIGTSAASAGYDGVLKPGMTLCVESDIGEQGGSEGVKLEQQVLITDDGND
jgi:Xaa-Pro aminopeptidase